MPDYFLSGIQCLTLVARFHQLPAEVNALSREFQHNDPALSDINLIRAAKSLGFKAKFIKDKPEKLSKHLLPAIARHEDGHFFIIAKATNDEVLIHDLTSQKPQTLSFAQLESVWTGDLLLLSKRNTLVSASAKFGFSWFIPALKKYKKFFADVFFSFLFYSISRVGYTNIFSSSY